MKIMKSNIDSTVILSEIKGYRPEANFTVSLSRISLAGSVAWAIDKSGEISYYSSLAEALNNMTRVINSPDEQKQLLRALI